MNTVSPCTAFIAVQKNKMKEYGFNQYYLKDKQEFEIGLLNYTTDVVIAKISINGKLLSQAGIIIKPGQRIILERFIEENKKFLFETYQVANTKEVAKAIADNGNIEVKFYKEKKITPTPYYSTGSTTTTNDNNIWSCFNSQSFVDNSVMSYASSNSDHSGMMNVNNVSNSRPLHEITSEVMVGGVSGTIETGRVEKGSTSSQRFKNYVGEFESFPCDIVNIKLLPFSMKPVDVSDLATYCTNCGTKNKKGNYKFCPKCGTRY